MALKEKTTKMPPTGYKGAKKPKKAKRFSYAPYIYKVLKREHPSWKISREAMSVMESCVSDTFERVATEARRLALMKQKDTLGERVMQSAVRLAFPGELALNAVRIGKLACENYKRAQ